MSVGKPVGNMLSLDLVRGFAALFVVFFHINEPIPYEPGVWTWICKQGWLGVTAFFIVSGFCMGLLENRMTPRAFLLSRLTRIYPPYLASLVVVVFSILLLKLLFGVNDSMPLPREPGLMLAQLFMAIQPLTTISAINWVYWSLVVEIFFYLYFCLALCTPPPVRRHFLVLPLLLPAGYAPLTGEVSPLFWAGYYPIFLMGYFAHAWLRQRARLDAFALFAAFLACCAWRTPPESAVALGTLLIVLALPQLPSGWPSRVVLFLSETSYSLYLIHVPIACFILLKWRNGFLQGGQTQHMLADIVVVLTTLVVARIFYLVIERPSHRWARLFAGVAK